ncbi:MAG: hypothetical protein U0V64_14710 [Cyclobacteriaceae bacterium]
MRFDSTHLNPENTWQIGTGDDTRMYFDVFLRFGVALVGPGNPGRNDDPKTEEYYQKHGDNNWGAKLAKVKKGQWLIARKGKSLILAIGEVVSEYDYSPFFSDVEGWDLQHFIKVKWFRPSTNSETIQLPTQCLGQSTLQSCNIADVYNIIYSTEFNEIKPIKHIEQISDNQLSINEIIDSLVDHGVRVQDADNIGSTLTRIIRLTNYYINYHYNVSEAEIITFLVAPTLIALGWSEQKIKLQLDNIDLSIYKQAFDADEEVTRNNREAKIPQMVLHSQLTR